MSVPIDEKRIRCAYCGANNFSGAPSCWQCSRSLLVAHGNSAAPAQSYQPAAPVSGQPSNAGYSAQFGSIPVSPGSAYFAQQGQVDDRRAFKAAFWMGMLFPAVGLPVGLVFLMLDDERKARIGWATIGWSVVGLALNLAGLLLLIVPMMGSLGHLIPSAPGNGLKGLGSGENLPGLGQDPETILLHFNHLLNSPAAGVHLFDLPVWPVNLLLAAQTVFRA